MKLLLLSTLISLSVLSGHYLQAEPLTPGKWFGIVTMHHQPELESNFKVIQTDEEEYKITMFYDDRPYTFDKLDISDDEITFELDTGAKYDCKLGRKVKNIMSGRCTLDMENETRTILMEMQPLESNEPESLSAGESNTN